MVALPTPGQRPGADAMRPATPPDDRPAKSASGPWMFPLIIFLLVLLASIALVYTIRRCTPDGFEAALAAGMRTDPADPAYLNPMFSPPAGAGGGGVEAAPPPLYADILPDNVRASPPPGAGQPGPLSAWHETITNPAYQPLAAAPEPDPFAVYFDVAGSPFAPGADRVRAGAVPNGSYGSAASTAPGALCADADVVSPEGSMDNWI